MFCFPNSDHVMFSREFFFCLFINYVYIYTWMHVHKTTFERNSSLGYNHMVLNVKTKHAIATKSNGDHRKVKKVVKFIKRSHKAFDRASHEKLLFMLEYLGIGRSLLAWFRSYLSGRRQTRDR